MSATFSDAIKIHDLLEGSYIFQMPLFQRHYQWKVSDQIPRFWQDLLSLLDGEVDNSFLGAIVLQTERTGSAAFSTKFTVIDGQQRITTFYLFVAALAVVADVNNFEGEPEDLQREYLVSQKAKEKNQSKLIPTIPDNSNFNHILRQLTYPEVALRPEAGAADGPMVEAMEYFVDAISDYVLSDDESESIERFESLKSTFFDKMEVVQIILDKSHNANEVFDRLNTGGQPLSVLDLVRNEIFQTVSSDYDAAITLYERHWRPLEERFESALSNLDHSSREKVIDGYFFPYALTNNSQARKNRLLNELRDIWKELGDPENDTSGETIVKHMEGMRGPYLAMDQGIKPTGIGQELWEAILRLRRVPIPGVTLPYFMQLIQDVSVGTTSEADAKEVCAVVESFFVRRGFVGLEPTGLHAVFKKLWGNRAAADPQKIAEHIQTRTISFPTDDEVRTAISTKGLYRRAIEKFVLSEYESSVQETSYSKLSHLPKITTDHVMPQSWQGDWKEQISQEEHVDVVDLWGNLVPLSSPANSAKGAKNFQEAKEKLKREVSFVTTVRLLDEQSDWGKDKILERCEQLATWACNRWRR